MNNFLSGMAITLAIVFAFSIYFNNTVLPNKINQRCQDLGLMQYNSKVDDFVPKSDSLYINKGDVYYIIHGSLDGYNEWNTKH